MNFGLCPHHRKGNCRPIVSHSLCEKHVKYLFTSFQGQHYKVLELLLITNFRKVGRCLRRVQHLLIVSYLNKIFFFKGYMINSNQESVVGDVFCSLPFPPTFNYKYEKSKQKEEGRRILAFEYQPVPDKKWYHLPREEAARITPNSPERCGSAFESNQTVGWGAAAVASDGFLGSQVRKQQKWNKAHWQWILTPQFATWAWTAYSTTQEFWAFIINEKSSLRKKVNIP